MDKLIKALGIFMLVALTTAFGALLGGTLIWWLWPIAIPAAFPMLVSSGILAAELTWWQSVALSWLCHILLVRSTSTTSNSKE